MAQFGIILGHFGDVWASLDPLGAPWEERPDLGPRFGAFWDHFWDPLGTPWETLGHPKGAMRGPKTLTRGVSRGVPNQTPKMNHFGTPPGGAQVSSRLSESTIFKNSGGSLLDTILPTFWDPFGTQEGHWTLPGGPRRVKRGSQRWYQKGYLFLTPVLEPKWDQKQRGHSPNYYTPNYSP